VSCIVRQSKSVTYLKEQQKTTSQNKAMCVVPCCYEHDHGIEWIAYDLKTGRIICYLPIDDYRPEISGSHDWTEEDVLEHYGDWKTEMALQSAAFTSVSLNERKRSNMDRPSVRKPELL
jgi:hypothetical protein